jgi:hypothetical protein
LESRDENSHSTFDGDAEAEDDEDHEDEDDDAEDEESEEFGENSLNADS